MDHLQAPHLLELVGHEFEQRLVVAQDEWVLMVQGIEHSVAGLNLHIAFLGLGSVADSR